MTPEERLASLLESGRRDGPRGNGKQRALLALDAAQMGECTEPDLARGPLTQLRGPATTSGFLLKLSFVALLSVATSSLVEHGHVSRRGNLPVSSSSSVVDTASFASAGGSVEAAALAAPRPLAPSGDDDDAPPVRAMEPSGLTLPAPVAPAAPRSASRKVSPPATPARPPSTVSAGAAAAITGVASSSDLLRDELALVDEASRALARRRCVHAAQAIDRYRARFPSGRLRDEVDVISIELTGMRGDHVSAAARAQAFLALRPKSPYATRLSPWLSTNPGSVGARSCAE